MVVNESVIIAPSGLPHPQIRVVRVIGRLQRPGVVAQVPADEEAGAGGGAVDVQVAAGDRVLARLCDAVAQTAP